MTNSGQWYGTMVIHLARILLLVLIPIVKMPGVTQNNGFSTQSLIQIVNVHVTCNESYICSVILVITPSTSVRNTLTP